MRWADFGDWQRIEVVHCGIESARFPEPLPMPDGPLRLVCIGRFAEQKGLLLLPEAMRLARAQGADLRLTLVGDGPMRGAVEAVIRAHDMQDRITLTGWLDEAGVRAALAQSHALVLPSYAEGLPMVLMEAMASGRAVIATWIAGNPELVQPGRNGWLVPAGCATSLARAMIEAAATPPETLQAMGREGRARVLRYFDVDTEAARLAELFQDVAAR